MLEGQLVDLASELEWNVVAIFHQRDPGAGVLANVKGFVFRERDRGGVFHGVPRHLLPVHGQHASPSLAQTRTVGLEVEDDGVIVPTVPFSIGMWEPNLFRNTTAIYPFQGNPGWNLETAMADEAIQHIKELKESPGHQS